MSWIDEMEERFICFSAAVCIEISKQSNDYAMMNLKQQIIRAATSVSLNYAEARAAESSRDFIHKLKLALKELN